VVFILKSPAASFTGGMSGGGSIRNHIINTKAVA
jgi:hypothetical protein